MRFRTSRIPLRVLVVEDDDGAAQLLQAILESETGTTALGRARHGREALTMAALLNESARDLLGHDLEIDEDTFRKALDPVAFVAAHAVTGGAAPNAVRESVASARATLDERKRVVEDDRTALADAGAELAARVARLRERVAAE
jgi:CheY-like chemotaxis protein